MNNSPATTHNSSPHPLGDEPLEIKSGSAVVKIYPTWDRKYHRTEDGQKKLKVQNPQFTVAYYVGSTRKLRKFSSLENAKSEAKSIAAKISSGDIAAVQLAGRDAVSYSEAKKVLASLDPGMPLDVAIRRFVDAEASLGKLGSSIEVAAKDYALRNAGLATSRSLQDIVEEFIEFKRSTGLGHRYIKDLNRLRKFSHDLSLTVNDLTTDIIQAFLAPLGSARTQHNYFRLIRTLINYAVQKKYVSPSLLEEINLVALPRIPSSPTEIFTPDELIELLTVCSLEILPWLAAGAFCGVRMAEFLKLDWKDIDLERKLVFVQAQNAKTAARRAIPLCASGCELLQPLKQASGKAAHYSQENKFTAAATIAVNRHRQASSNDPQQFVWKKNALRHSFCSYRLAQLKNAAQVAYEAGNSPAMLFRHYHELVAEDEAERWFNAMPLVENIGTS